MVLLRKTKKFPIYIDLISNRRALKSYKYNSQIRSIKIECSVITLITIFRRINDEFSSLQMMVLAIVPDVTLRIRARHAQVMMTVSASLVIYDPTMSSLMVPSRTGNEKATTFFYKMVIVIVVRRREGHVQQFT